MNSKKHVSIQSVIRTNRIKPVILAGGLGTRLKSIVSDVPKVMAPVFGKPFITILLDQIASARFKDVFICTGFKSEIIKKYIKGMYRNLKICYSEEKFQLGTGGAVINLIKTLPEEIELILVMNGDSFINIDLNKYIEWYIGKNINCALALKNVENSDRYGCVEIDKNHKVLGFFEKKQLSGRGWINAGVYIFRKNVFDNFKSECNLSMEKEILPKLVNNKMFGYECDGEFIDIGTPESYAIADQFFQKINYASK